MLSEQRWKRELVWTFLSLFIVAGILICLQTPTVQASNIKVTVNGDLLDMPVSPVVVDGRTLVPLRNIFEALGGKINFDSSTKSIVGYKGQITIILQPNSRTAQVSGKEVTLDTPPTIINNITMVPVRFIAENLGEKVNWDEFTRTIEIGQGDPSQSMTLDSKTIYRGKIAKGQPSGMGKSYSLIGKLKYEGEWKLGVMNGQGKYYYSNGTSVFYSGEWRNGKMNGKGIQYYPNGAVEYDGEFKDGLRDGIGKLFDTKGSLLISGTWEEGLPIE